MKFTTNHSKYFKEWNAGNVRILKDVCSTSFYPYEVQKFDGARWDNVRFYHTLAEAKRAVAWIIADDLN